MTFSSRKIKLWHTGIKKPEALYFLDFRDSKWRNSNPRPLGPEATLPFISAGFSDRQMSLQKASISSVLSFTASLYSTEHKPR